MHATAYYLIGTWFTTPVYYVKLFSLSHPSVFDAYDAWEEDFGGIFFALDGIPFVWAFFLPEFLPFHHHISVLKLFAHIFQLALCILFVEYLAHTIGGIDHTAIPDWIRKGSISNDVTIADLLIWRAFLLVALHTISSTTFVQMIFNFMSDAASCLAFLPPSFLYTHVDTVFLKQKSWTYVPLTLNIMDVRFTVLSRMQSNVELFLAQKKNAFWLGCLDNFL